MSQTSTRRFLMPLGIPSFRCELFAAIVGALGLFLISGCAPESSPPAAPHAEPQKLADSKATAQSHEIRGVDVSDWQRKGVNFAGLKNDGISFVFIKATQGERDVDADYANDVRNAQAAGLATGSYHYYVASESPDKQFQNFTSHLSWQSGDLPPVVDIETLGKKHNSDSRRPELAANLKKFLDMIEGKYRVKPIIYSGEYFANEYLKGFADYPLWVAEYNNNPSPQLPLDWKAWTFWQYTQSGKISGIPGAADMNHFNGSAQDFEKLRVKNGPAGN